jgi:alkylation response protein AidB-like acyl-CoA dehydrogenase
MPRGKAIVVDGGYRLTGRWPFCSGSQHASWLGCNSIVYDGSEPRRYPDGAPVQRMMVFPASSATYLDTWYSGGLKGTGSLDVEVTDLFVPAAYSYWWAEPQHPGPLYTGRWFLLSHAGHALGLARAAIDALMELAQTKVPARSQALLRDRPLAQRQVAEADVLVGSARSYCWETVQQVWDRVSAGEPLSRLYQARVRLANTYAVTASARAVDLMYSAAGGSAVYATHPLDRIFRDIHTATQHSLVAEHTYETIGQVLLHPDPESLPLPGNIHLF